MIVVGTAGHIDHGKSTLVHRLTGMDPDRLEEEKRRGMTIDLGFAWVTLPSGRRASLVDVPGHERFIRNMLAGASGIDAALLVVAADESVMPQTREHLHILSLLNIKRAVVAVTKIDLVDRDFLDLVIEDIAGLLNEGPLRGSPIVPVSARTGEGIDALLAHLDSLSAEPNRRSDSGITMFPVDRVFVAQGFGTVVTGTLHAGELWTGQELEVLPSEVHVRVRGVQVHGEPVERVGAGQRAALNIAGLSRHSVERGDVLAAPGTIVCTSRFDACLEILADAPFAVRHGMRATVHAGAAERGCTIRILDSECIAAGETGWVRIVTDAPLPLVRGQRFVIRVPAPGRTIGGGEVVDVIPASRRDPRLLDRLKLLSSSQLNESVRGVLLQRGPVSARDAAVRLGVTVESAHRVLEALVREKEAVKLGTLFLSVEAWNDLNTRLRVELERFHSEHPLRWGMSRDELRKKLRVDAAVWPAVLAEGGAEGTIHQRDGEIALAGAEGGPATQRVEADAVLARLGAEPLSPPPIADLLAGTGASRTLLKSMAGAGEIVAVAEEMYVTPEAIALVEETVVEMIRETGDVSAAQVRDRLGTSRKYAVAFLEYLDAVQVTRRRGESRVLGPRASTCASP